MASWEDKYAIAPTGQEGAPEAWEDRFATAPTAVQARRAAPYDVAGAPYSMRLKAGTAPTFEDQLATIRQEFPDATPTADGNVIYTDKAGRRVLYNKPGLDLGDIPSVTREAAEAVGGTAGAMAGAVGGVPGSLLGAGMGTAAAGKGVDLLRSAFGLPQSYSAARTAGDIAAGAAGEAGGQLLAAGGRALANRTMIRPGAQETLAAAQRAGVNPTASMVGRNNYALGEHTGAAVLPGSRPQRAYGQLYGEATRQLEAARPRPATVNPTNLAEAEVAAGGALKSSADTAYRAFRAARQRLDDAFYAAMPSGVRIRLPTVQARAQAFQQEIARAPGSAPARLGPALEVVDRINADLAANRGALPPDLLRRARRDLGELLEVRATTELPASSQAALRDLYGALNTDLRAGAAAVSPRAERALARQDRLVRAFRGEDLGRESTAGSLDKILKANSDEQAWTAFQSKTGGLDRLRTLVRRMSPEELRIVSRANWERLTTSGQGNPTGPIEWATKWRAMPQESKRLLFGSQMDISQLDDLAQVLRAQAEGAHGKNWSGTAYELERMKLLQSVWDGLKKAAGVGGTSMASSQLGLGQPIEEIATGAGAGYALTEMIYHPRFIRAMVEAAGNLGTPTGPKTRFAGQAYMQGNGR